MNDRCGIGGETSRDACATHGHFRLPLLASRPAPLVNSTPAASRAIRSLSTASSDTLRMPTRTCQFNVSHSGIFCSRADEKYVPEVLAYIHDVDVNTLDALLLTMTPEEVVATFPYLSDLEKIFACRAPCSTSGRAACGRVEPLPPHLMEWMARKRKNGQTAGDTPGAP